jgi:hypothetical protein
MAVELFRREHEEAKKALGVLPKYSLPTSSCIVLSEAFCRPAVVRTYEFHKSKETNSRFVTNVHTACSLKAKPQSETDVSFDL